MWEHPVTFGLGKRDVTGAWLVCLAFLVACFALLAAAAPERGGSPTGLMDPHPPTVATADTHRQAKC
jgi:hypothetical protein